MLSVAVEDVLSIYAVRINPTADPDDVAAGVQSFMDKLQGEAFKNSEELLKDVDAVAQYLWTSGKRHHVVHGMELCSVLNAVIRDDVEAEIKAAITIFRSINNRLVERSEGHVDPYYPRGGETWRGGGFRTCFRPFFEQMVSKKYRVPGFLATSSKRRVAAEFAFKASNEHPRVLWRVMFDRRGKHDPEYRVQHMTLVSKTLVKGEHEYLFAPYSVFTLVSVKWSKSLRKPHEFTIQAACNNKSEPEDLPLVPWY